jgi:hypothetical protein
MTFIAAMRRLGAATLFAGLCAVTLPAHAEIEKFMKPCDGALCPSFRASITVPDGWVEDKEASEYFEAQMLLPKDQEFEKAQAKIYAVVRFNPKKQPIADFIPDALQRWRKLAKDAKITKLDPLPRTDGKPPFERHQFAARSLKEQGHELQAVTSDGDKDGNMFLVTIVLSANSPSALKSAEAAYLAILRNY